MDYIGRLVEAASRRPMWVEEGGRLRIERDKPRKDVSHDTHREADTQRNTAVMGAIRTFLRGFGVV